MATIETKYSIGDQVWAVSIVSENVGETCPDCLGLRLWKCELPNGEKLNIECPTCKRGYQTMGKIDKYQQTHKISQLTIGMIYSVLPTKYMCVETGVGSGTIWHETSLYDSEAEAIAACPALLADAAERQRQCELERFEARNENHLKGDNTMVAYYRKEIRDAKKKLEQAQKQLDNIQAGRML